VTTRGARPPPPAERERRPVLVEIAAALLIVTGVLQLVAAIGIAGSLPPGTEGLLALSVGLEIATIVAGVLVRTGRLWLLVVNYVAVLGFLDLLRSAASPIALMFAIFDAFVLYVLFTNRPWFARRQRDEPNEPADEDEPRAD
jgi:hypothetical protein